MTAATFPYHRSLSPTLGVLLGIALVESLVVHVIAMALWGWKVAVILLLIDFSAVLTLVGLLRSFRRLPVTIERNRLLLRAGWLKSIELDIGEIAGLREHWDAAAIKRRDVLNLALAAWPNVVIDLRRPVGKRGIVAVAHRFDDPDAFRMALRHRSIE